MMLDNRMCICGEVYLGNGKEVMTCRHLSEILCARIEKVQSTAQSSIYS